MIRENLTGTEILTGTFSLIYAIIAIIIGLLFFKKYLSTKQFEHVTIGLTYIFMSSGWWGASTTFLSILILDINISDFAYFILADLFALWAVVTWIYSMYKIMYKKHGKLLIVISLILVIPFEIISITCLIIDPAIYGFRPHYFDAQESDIFSFYLLFSMIITILTVCHFAFQSLEIKDSKIRLKAILLLIAVLSFAIGSTIDQLYTDFSLMITSGIILVSSAILFYWAWNLPKVFERLIDRKPA